MSEPILILGDSGSGKSYSCRNLDPQNTLLVSVDGKRYPFSMKDWDKVTVENPQGAYYVPGRKDPYRNIRNLLATTTKQTIVIDDSQFLLCNEFFNRAFETGYQKFTDMAYKFHGLIDFCRDLKDDVTVYFMHHTELEGEKIKVKTVGKMLDQQTNVQGKFTVCLMSAKMEDNYIFSSSVTSQPIFKSPPGMFEEDPFENDLAEVDKKIREYWGMS